ncbi:hypothetical protein ACFY9C_29440 [Streptomyces filamentosus]|uniref:hypothetical protein n=1 Tax=Streptomyces filamentosus TaxID=67294 RepID=UPI0036E4AA58
MRGTHNCPGCGRDDRVQAVPAAYLAGRDRVTGRERDADGDLRTVTRTVTTGLSDALAPVPDPPGHGIAGLGVLAAFVALGTFVVGVQAGHWFEDDAAGGAAWPETGPPVPEAAAPPGFAVLGWISAAALLAAVLAAVVTLRRRAAHARRLEGRARAEELWSRGWYCHRCGTVHLDGVPGEDHAPLTLQRFREKVWERGGYGDLAAVHRAVDPGRGRNTG